MARVSEGEQSRVLVLSLVFAPDGVSTAQLMTELTTDLTRLGLQVFVITTKPHYNRDPVAERAQPITPVWPGLLWESEIGGVKVYHTRAGGRKGGIFRRAPGWVLFHLVALAVALIYVRRAKVILVPSPLLTLGALGAMLTRPLRAKLVYNVQELYPDIAIELGMMRNRSLIRSLRWLERFVYHRAAAVTAITEGIRTAVVAKGVDPKRVVVIPNFVDITELKPAPKDNEFAKAHGWQGKFVVLYAGNIGYAQGLDALLAAAKEIEASSEVLFAFVGEGPAKAELAAHSLHLGLSNTTFIQHQSYADVPQIYAAADLCIVALIENIRVAALPSKVFRIMACGRPVLALCDPNADLGSIVRDVGTGLVCRPDDTRGIVDAILMLKQAPAIAAEMGARGRAYVVDSLSRSKITKEYAHLFQQVSA